MGVLFLIIFFFVSFLIVGLVLLQEGKGGGLTGMSTGMDGVMGAKNPLRRMTAWLFVFFVIMAVTINWYFHNQADTVLPTGASNIPASNVRTLEGTAPMGDTVVTEGGLRPEEIPAEPAEPVRPETTGETLEVPAESVKPGDAADAAIADAAKEVEDAAAALEEKTEELDSKISEEAAAELRPETPAETAPVAEPVQPPAGEEAAAAPATESVTPPAAEEAPAEASESPAEETAAPATETATPPATEEAPTETSESPAEEAAAPATEDAPAETSADAADADAEKK